MKKRRAFISTVCIVLVLLMVLSISVAVFAPTAHAAKSDDIQDEIDDLNSQKSEIQGRMNEVQSEIDSLDYEKANTLEKKLMLDRKNTLAQEELDVIQEQIDIMDGRIASLQADLTQARAEEEYQQERWLTRVRDMEETSDVSYIQVLFEATSFSDLLTRIDLVNEVATYDEALAQEYVSAREKVETLEAEAEEIFAANEANRQEMEAKKTQLETDINAACALIATMDSDIDDYNEVLEQEAATKAEIDALIVDKEAELQEAKAAEEAARLAALAAQQAAQAAAQGSITAPPAVTGGVSAGGGGFMWPSYTRYITSYFGMRTNPVSGVYKSHDGVDIGAAYGTAIYAAAGGTVVTAGWYGGYGNCVMINHGNGYTTLYGHQSRLAVSAGQTVSQGQVIGYVGSTGNSTGPHLHFEVRASATATPINPLSFTYY